MPRSVLYNLYGTSEIWDATWFVPADKEVFRKVVPIGHPISNTRVYVVDRHNQPVPVGVTGELLVGGDGLANGYLHQEELTAERFISDPFSNEPDARLYRTGDLVRWRADGELEFMGRLDHQVKVRGFRIEMGEIEAALLQHSAVRETVVVVREEEAGDKRIVAYVVPETEADIHMDAVREFLQGKLPGFMVPNAFVMLTTLPLGPSGKLNRRALPAPTDAVIVQPDKFVAPQTPMEEQLVQAYRDVLQREKVGVYDHFFSDLGGHSLLATQLASLVRTRMNVQLPLRLFFEAPTVADLAEAITLAMQVEQKDTAPALVPVDRNQYRVTSTQ